MNSPSSGLLESVINSYLPFEIFHDFSMTVAIRFIYYSLYVADGVQRKTILFRPPLANSFVIL